VGGTSATWLRLVTGATPRSVPKTRSILGRKKFIFTSWTLRWVHIFFLDNKLSNWTPWIVELTIPVGADPAMKLEEEEEEESLSRTQSSLRHWIPDTWAPWLFSFGGLFHFLLYSFWLNFKRNQDYKIENSILLDSTWVDPRSKHIIWYT